MPLGTTVIFVRFSCNNGQVRFDSGKYQIFYRSLLHGVGTLTCITQPLFLWQPWATPTQKIAVLIDLHEIADIENLNEIKSITILQSKTLNFRMRIFFYHQLLN